MARKNFFHFHLNASIYSLHNYAMIWGWSHSHINSELYSHIAITILTHRIMYRKKNERLCIFPIAILEPP